jgi:hypothetical protein
MPVDLEIVAPSGDIIHREDAYDQPVPRVGEDVFTPDGKMVVVSVTHAPVEGWLSLTVADPQDREEVSR